MKSTFTAFLLTICTLSASPAADPAVFPKVGAKYFVEYIQQSESHGPRTVTVIARGDALWCLVEYEDARRVIRRRITANPDASATPSPTPSPTPPLMETRRMWLNFAALLSAEEQ